VVEYLQFFGLNVSTHKCKVLVVGSNVKEVILGGHTIKTEEYLRFLGLKITNKGQFLPWRDEFTSSIFGVKGRLVQAGLGNLPIAMVKAI
jgi:hypothetical protein